MTEPYKQSQHLLKFGEDLFSLHDVLGDGNCFFRAICKDDNFEGYQHLSLCQEFVRRVNSILDGVGPKKI